MNGNAAAIIEPGAARAVGLKVESTPGNSPGMETVLMKLLIVDDDKDSRDAAQIIFEHEGFTVTCAVNGLEALQILEQTVPDAIISDVLMPLMDGFALCQQCKADDRFRHIPFIFYTATYRDAMDKQLAEKLGAALYIMKPEMPSALVKSVREVLADKNVVLPAAKTAAPVPERDFLKLHSDALLRKLEEKNTDLENTNRRLEQDIAERKRTESALRKSEQRFRSLTTFAPVGIYQTDAKGWCTFANRRWCEITGLSPVEAVGQWWAKTAHPDDRDIILPALEKAITGALWSREFRHIDAAGRTTWVQGTMVPLFDENGAVSGYLGTSEDITARKKAEETIQQSEKKLSDITSQVGEGILVYTTGCRITFMNPEAERLLGWTMEELNARGAHDTIHARKSDGAPLPREESRLHTVLKTGERYSSMDEVFMRKDGTRFPVSTTTAPIIENNTVVAVVITFRDISDRIRIEEERERLISELQQTLAKVKTLSGLLPICASCKKIRDDKGYWTRIEEYLSRHSDAEFSHGLCPECAEKLYKEYLPKKDPEKTD
jgi:PAS domain S-box-containing protein